MLTQYGIQLAVLQEPKLPGETAEEWSWSPSEVQLVSAGSPLDSDVVHADVTSLVDVSISLAFRE